MLTISRAELEEMRGRIIDEETEMTALDLFEWQHAGEDWAVIE